MVYLPGSTFHTLMVVYPPEKSRLPSGDNARLSTAPVCPRKVRISLPASRSHTLIVVSQLPENSRLPSADQRQASHRDGMPAQGERFLARLQVPHLDRLVTHSPRRAACRRPPTPGW